MIRNPYVRDNWRTYGRLAVQLRPERMSPVQVYKALAAKYSNVPRVVWVKRKFVEISRGEIPEFALAITPPPIDSIPYGMTKEEAEALLRQLIPFIQGVNGVYRMALSQGVLGFQYRVKITYQEEPFPMDPEFLPPREPETRVLNVGDVLVGLRVPDWLGGLAGVPQTIRAVLLHDRNPDRPVSYWAPHVSQEGMLCAGEWLGRVFTCFRKKPMEAGFLLGELIRAYSVENGPYAHAYMIDPGSLYSLHRAWEDSRQEQRTQIYNYWSGTVAPALHLMWSTETRRPLLLSNGKLDYQVWKDNLLAKVQTSNMRRRVRLSCGCGYTGTAIMACINARTQRLELKCESCGFITCELCGVPMTGGAIECREHGLLCPQCYYLGLTMSNGAPRLDDGSPEVGTLYDDYLELLGVAEDSGVCRLCKSLQDGDRNEVLRTHWGLPSDWNEWPPDNVRATTPVYYMFPLMLSCQYCMDPEQRVYCTARPYILTGDGWACEDHYTVCENCERAVMSGDTVGSYCADCESDLSYEDDNEEY